LTQPISRGKLKAQERGRDEARQAPLDIGLATNDLGPMLAFWQGEAGIPFDHLLPIRKGQDQHRHDVNWAAC
jgi:hypothetical protein